MSERRYDFRSWSLIELENLSARLAIIASSHV